MAINLPAPTPPARLERAADWAELDPADVDQIVKAMRPGGDYRFNDIYRAYCDHVAGEGRTPTTRITLGVHLSAREELRTRRANGGKHYRLADQS
jgi:hypothetical protein